MRKKGQKGFVIELMVIFMLVTFGFCMVVTTFIGSLSLQRKYAKQEVNNQTVLNQLGEYYMRSVEADSTFPVNSSGAYRDVTTSEYKDFKWMDDNCDGVINDFDETVQFFKEHSGLTYTDKTKANADSFLQFYQTMSLDRRLTVSSEGKKKMVLTVKEIFVDRYTSDCEIVTWYVGDDLTPSDDDAFNKKVDLNVLQKLWRFLGTFPRALSNAELFQNRGLLNTFRDILEFFNIAGEIWDSGY